MFEIGSHDPFGHLKHKLWLKEGSRVKLAIWFLTTKSQESPQFPCMQVACHIPLESSWQGLQHYFRPHLNQRSADKVMGPKVAGVPTLGISGFPLGSLRKNAIWMLVSWPTTEYTIRGKVVASPKFRSWWVLCVQVCPWIILAPKVLKLSTNQLIV
jgi:hypothetical protein